MCVQYWMGENPTENARAQYTYLSNSSFRWGGMHEKTSKQICAFFVHKRTKKNNAQHSKQGSTNDEQNAEWRYEEQQILGVVRAVSPAHDQRRWTQQPAVIHERNDDQMCIKDVNKWHKMKGQTNNNKMQHIMMRRSRSVFSQETGERKSAASWSGPAERRRCVGLHRTSRTKPETGEQGAD